MDKEPVLRNGGPEGDEPEAVVLLGVGTGEFHKETRSPSTPEFIDELEETISNTDRLYVRESQQAIPDFFTTFDVTTVYDVLDRNGERCFSLGRCREKGSVLSFVIVTNYGHGVLNFKRTGLFSQNFEVEGAGILQFDQVRDCCGGYTLQDKWKKLLRIRASWVGFCTFCLLSPDKTATMEFLNLDGTPSGTLSYKKWINLGFEDRSLCIHFIPQLNRKAKYMVFAASLMPFTSYFIEPGRSKNSVLLIILYTILCLVVIIVIVGLLRL